MRLRDGRLDRACVPALVEDVLRVGIGSHGLEVLPSPRADVIERHVVGFDDSVLASALDHHVAESHPLFHREPLNRLTAEFHGLVRPAIDPDLADEVQDDVLRHEVRRELAVEHEAHGRRHLHEKLPGPEDERRVGVADAGRELIERTRRAGVRVGSEEHLARPAVAFLRERDVAHAFVAGRADVVVVRQALLLHELPQDVDVTMAFVVGSEDVVVGDDDDLVAVPDLRVRPELALEDSDRPRPAHVVRHERVDVRPHVVARPNGHFAGRARQDLLGHRHCHRMRLPFTKCTISSRTGDS